MNRASFVLGAALVATTFATGAARAQADKSDVDRAERLFREAKALMSDGKFSEACPKLRESQSIDPATGTLLALALCHESEGKLATAYREFKTVLPATQAEKRRDRENLVQARLKDLAARAPKIIVVLEGAAAREPDLTVRVDGETLARADLGAELPVDSGEHVVEANHGERRFRDTVVIQGERSVRRVVVAELSAPVVAASSPPAPPPTPTPGADRNRRSGEATSLTGLALMGAGAVGIGVGAFFGVQAIQKSNDAKSMCDPAACVDPRALSVNDEAKSAATVSTIAIALGASAVVGGFVLWRVGKSASVAAAPALGPGHIGASAAARF